MAPNTQKIVAPRRSGARRRQPSKSQGAPSPTPSVASTQGPTRIKLTFKRGQTGQPDERDADLYQFPLSAPPSDDAKVQGDIYDTSADKDSLGTRRGARQRKPPQQRDLVYGSEMDDLLTSSATIAKADDDEEDIGMNSSPPHIFTLRAADRIDSPIAQGHGFIPHSNLVPEDVYNILNTLRSSSEIQIDLPNMWLDEVAGIPKPYTAAFLTALYIQCYENSLWHICDLVADTWIRALQDANTSSQKSSDKQSHVWRKNAALERRFQMGKLGFKKETQDLGLDIEDPDMAPDAAKILPKHITDLYAHTRPRCGARLLWADAMALAGRKMESEMSRRPDKWPGDLLFDVMCSALRLVGRKLTLKIEEKYEGAWCRYHEHAKHGLSCYRQLAAKQTGAKDSEDAGVSKGRKRAGGANGVGERDAKRVRFSVGAQGDIDTDGEGASED